MTDALETVTDDWFADFPESARTVATILALRGPTSPSTIAERTHLSYRTVRRRCRQLESVGLVASSVDPTDSRYKLYEISDTRHD